MTHPNDIFDLMISNTQRLQILYNMDKNDQFETIKRLLDIYRLSGVKKLEKFFVHVCIFNSCFNLYLKQEILYILYCKAAKKFQTAFSNILFLILQEAFNYNEYWLMLE
jgi:hypothetical protein